MQETIEILKKCNLLSLIKKERIIFSTTTLYSCLSTSHVLQSCAPLPKLSHTTTWQTTFQRQEIFAYLDHFKKKQSIFCNFWFTGIWGIINSTAQNQWKQASSWHLHYWMLKKVVTFTVYLQTNRLVSEHSEYHHHKPYFEVKWLKLFQTCAPPYMSATPCCQTGYWTLGKKNLDTYKRQRRVYR